MEYLSKRVSLKKDGDEISIVILSYREKSKNLMLLIWLILWTICGFIVLSQYFFTQDTNVKSTIIVWIGFWAYFEYKILNAYRWRKYGAEKLKIKDGVVYYKRDLGKSSKWKEYKVDSIKNLRQINKEDASFWDMINDSYWTVSGEKLGFEYIGSEVKFGMQLTEDEIKSLMKQLRTRLKG